MIISCKSIFSPRVYCVLKFVNAHVRVRPAYYYQGNCSYYSLGFYEKMTGPKVRLGGMEKSKKQRIVTHTWRAVSSQANPAEEGCSKDVTAESDKELQLNEVHCSESSSISNVQPEIKAVEAVTEVTDSSVFSSTMDYETEASGQEESLLSMEKHSLTVEVGASLIRFIKGKEGSTQRKIEEETGVKILFPSSKDSISIEGSSIASITRAQEKIQEIIDEAVNSRSLDYSHFISLPLALNPELVEKLINFQKSILGNRNSSLDKNVDNDSNEDTNSGNKDQEMREGCNVGVKLNVKDERHVKVDVLSVPEASKSPFELGIDKSIFIKPKTFHLTVLMLKLWNKERVLAASEVLKSISSKVRDALENRPVYIRLKGLDTMKGSMSKARVLYATVEEIGNEDRLVRACQVITDAFVEAGLVLEKDAKQKLKLHATVMNARHRKGKRSRKWNDSFDARGIFKQYGSKEWGEYLIREAHLSQRFVFDENGYYHCCASIPFPEEMQTD